MSSEEGKGKGRVRNTSAMNFSFNTKAISDPCNLTDSLRMLKGAFARSYVADSIPSAPSTARPLGFRRR